VKCENNESGVYVKAYIVVLSYRCLVNIAPCCHILKKSNWEKIVNTFHGDTWNSRRGMAGGGQRTRDDGDDDDNDDDDDADDDGDSSCSLIRTMDINHASVVRRRSIRMQIAVDFDESPQHAAAPSTVSKSPACPTLDDTMTSRAIANILVVRHGHSGPLSQAITSWVRAWCRPPLGKKRRALCIEVCPATRTDITYWLKAVAEFEAAIRPIYGLYASLIGSILAGLKVIKGDGHPINGSYCLYRRNLLMVVS